MLILKALIGTKLGMTQIIEDDGTVVQVSLIQAGPCTVTQIKTNDKDGYEAIQLGFGDTKRANKAQIAHTKAAKVNPRIMKEIRHNIDTKEVAVGDSFNVEVFTKGDKVDVIGTTKGKGFAGVIKKWNFSRQRATHGAKGNTRKGGSIGSMYPQKVMKGKKMSGRLGNAQKTSKRLTVAYIDVDANVVGVRGSIPGPKKSVVVIQGAI